MSYTSLFLVFTRFRNNMTTDNISHARRYTVGIFAVNITGLRLARTHNNIIRVCYHTITFMLYV